MKTASAPTRDCRLATLVLAIGIVAFALNATGASAAPVPDVLAKLDPSLQRAIAQQQPLIEALVQLDGEADPALLDPRQEYRARRRAWVAMLQATAQDRQAALRDWLDQRHIEYRAFWINNSLWLRADAATLLALAERGEVLALDANTASANRLPQPQPATSAMAVPDATDTIEWGVSTINAPSVWAAGITGQGVVMAGQDTGYRWDHNAVKAKYRGWNGAVADHDYHWHDAIHVLQYGSACAANSPAPCDDNGHGTHTLGTMLGDDGAGNQIGVAPGARWIGCRNMENGHGTPSSYIECMQWLLAPTDLTGANPQPDLAPDVVSNSWGCPPSEGCTSGQELVGAVNSVVNAGIFFAAAAGNDGNSSSSGCATIFDAPAIYASAFVVAASTSSDTIATFSSRGPVAGAPRVLPDVAAPGLNVRSSYNTSVSAYTTLSGTSMATPHVAGAAALLMATNPALKGHPDQIAALLRSTATPIDGGTQICGNIAANTYPNPVQGSGRIDVYAAFLVAEKIFRNGFGGDAND